MANVRVSPGLLRFEDVEHLDPDTEGGNLVDGRWIPVTKNTWRHGEIVINVSVLLHAYAKARGGLRVAAGDPGAKLRRNPDTLRGPDVALIAADRLPTGKGRAGWLEGAPDLAVEVMGDDQSTPELARKAAEYLAAGAKMVWVLDADPMQVTVYTAPDHVRLLGATERLEGGDALPGFDCSVADLFQ